MEVGTILSGRWRLTAPIGEGGMGLVFAAAHLGDGRRAAIKLLRPEMSFEPSIRTRFEGEATACMRLLHPNILRVLELAGSDEPTPYFVMELLDGVPLSDLLRPGRPVPEALAVSITCGILRGLGNAHSAGIVHRDLKPDNVFLARDASGQFTPKLLDFGIAKVMDAAGGMGTRTRTGALLGTPAYMSPEQARNGKDTDARTDVWSTGVVLFELLTGQQPFVAVNEFARLALVLDATPRQLASFDPSLAKWQPVIDSALAKNREARFQSAAEMERALTQLGGNLRPSTGLLATPHFAGEPGHRHAVSPAAFGDTAMALPPKPQLPEELARRAPGGSTLSSPYSSGPANSQQPFAPEIRIIPSPSGDRDGNTFRGREEGIKSSLVALFVLLALVAGMVTGFALGRV